MIEIGFVNRVLLWLLWWHVMYFTIFVLKKRVLADLIGDNEHTIL